MEISISVVPMIIFSVVSVLIGLVLEFLYTEETIHVQKDLNMRTMSIIIM